MQLWNLTCNLTIHNPQVTDNSTADDKSDVDGFLSILQATTAESCNSGDIFHL
jgi:hypothetical protein